MDDQELKKQTALVNHEIQLRRYNTRKAAKSVHDAFSVGGVETVILELIKKSTVTRAVIWLMCLIPDERSLVYAELVRIVVKPTEALWLMGCLYDNAEVLEYLDYYQRVVSRITQMGETYFLTQDLTVANLTAAQLPIHHADEWEC